MVKLMSCLATAVVALSFTQAAPTGHGDPGELVRRGYDLSVTEQQVIGRDFGELDRRGREVLKSNPVVLEGGGSVTVTTQNHPVGGETIVTKTDDTHQIHHSIESIPPKKKSWIQNLSSSKPKTFPRPGIETMYHPPRLKSEKEAEDRQKKSTGSWFGRGKSKNSIPKGGATIFTQLHPEGGSTTVLKSHDAHQIHKHDKNDRILSMEGVPPKKSWIPKLSSSKPKEFPRQPVPVVTTKEIRYNGLRPLPIQPKPKKRWSW